MDWIFTFLAAAVIIGGLALACKQGIEESEKQEAAKKARKAADYNRVVIHTPTAQKPVKEAVKKPKKPTTSPETIEAMHKQADAERAIAEALEHKAQYITDPVKRARIEKQAATAWTQFNKILDRIDKLTAAD